MGLGTNLLYAAVFTGLFSVFANAMGSYNRDESWLRTGRLANYVVTALVVGATLLLTYYFLTDNFSIAYVLENSQVAQPVPYKISGLWGGQGGSLLLWAAYLAIFSAVVARTPQKPGLAGYASAVIMATEVFFVFLIVTTADPFVGSIAKHGMPTVPTDGMGLNPLLLNPGMVFHPPTLYAGFAGFVIPFAFAIAGLLQRDDDWMLYTRKWTVFAWLFLGIGILLGGWWAYVILGWGGYWAWDPVENGPLMAWLTGTAFLHSVMIQEKRGGLRIWNQVLIVLTYVLTIYGVFLTRSNVVNSVHSFAESGMSVQFVVFMATVLVLSFILMLKRRDFLKTDESLAESYVSKEVSFLLNNLLLLAIFFAVWWGTSFPFISEGLLGSKVSIGTSYFNQVTPPIAIALFVLMGICPLIPWKNASWENLKESFTYPVAAGVAAAVGGIVAGPMASLILGITMFVAASHILDTYRAYEVLGRNGPEKDPLKLLLKLVSKNRRRYGGYIVHFGILLILVGVTWSSLYVQEQQYSLQEGDTVQLPGGYNGIYQGTETKQLPDHTETIGVLKITKGGKEVYTAKPRIANYPRRQMNTRDPDIWSTLSRDLYFIFNGVRGGTASLSVKLNPLVYLIWIGGYVMMAGGLVAMWPEFSRRKEELSSNYTTSELLSKSVQGEEVVLAGKVEATEKGRALTDGDSSVEVDAEGLEEGSNVQLRGRFDGEVFHVVEGCKKCGAEVPDEAEFCPECGSELK